MMEHIYLGENLRKTFISCMNSSEILTSTNTSHIMHYKGIFG